MADACFHWGDGPKIDLFAVCSDRKIAVTYGSESEVEDPEWLFEYYRADVYSVTDYDPFGMVLAERSWAHEEYRFGFNGKENDTEWEAQDYGMREYSARLGRFFTADPLIVYGQMFVSFSAYLYAANNPVALIDWMGLAAGDPKTGDQTEEGGTRDDGETEPVLIEAESNKKYSRPEDRPSWAGRLINKVGGVLSKAWSAIKEVGHSFKHGYGTVVPAEYKRTRHNVDKVLGWAPVAGELIDARDIKEAYNDGRYGDMTLSVVGFVIPVVPGSAVKGGYKYLYRAVSQAELDDIAKNGLRGNGESMNSKWFATNAENASKWGQKFNSNDWDNQSFSIVRVKVPNEVLLNSNVTHFDEHLDKIGPGYCIHPEAFSLINNQRKPFKPLNSVPFVKPPSNY